MEFLLKALVGIKTGKSISTSKIYETWSELLKNADEVKSFAEKLPQSAVYIDRIGKGMLPVTGSATDLGTECIALNLFSKSKSYLQEVTFLNSVTKCCYKQWKIEQCFQCLLMNLHRLLKE
jgi:hypothetical protein